jgi:hypothetical protein
MSFNCYVICKINDIVIAHGVYILTYIDVDHEREGCLAFLAHNKNKRQILCHAAKDGLMFRCVTYELGIFLLN